MLRLQVAGFVAAIVLTLSLHSNTVAAQPGAAPPNGQTQPPSRQTLQKWGIGLHASSAEFESSANPDNTIEMSGGGVHVRYRVNHRWSFDVSVDHLEGEYRPGIDRDSRPMTLSAILHLSRSPTWNWYLQAGLGGSRDLVTSVDPNGRQVELEYRQSHVQFGAGLERRWTNLGIGAELRLTGAARNDEYSRGAPLDGPVPIESSGAVFNLAATYYF